MRTTSSRTESSPIAPAVAPRPLLAVVGLVLEVVAFGAVLLDGRALTWIAWLPGWAGVVLVLIGIRTGGRARVLTIAVLVLFVAGTILGIAAAVR